MYETLNFKDAGTESLLGVISLLIAEHGKDMV
jgi:hypothetical protein